MALDRTPADEGAGKGKGEQTRRHLIEAALSLFAESGFRRTSIRDIANAAAANVAAVNYHFGSKESLYRAAFHELAVRFDRVELQAVRDAVEASGGRPSVEAVFEAFARAWSRPSDGPETRRAAMLVTQELAEPLVGAEFLLEEFIEPLERELGGALRAACPEAKAETVQLCIHLFLAQLSHLNKVQLHLTGLGADRVALLADAQAVERSVRFTSAGFRALVEEHSTSANDADGGSR